MIRSHAIARVAEVHDDASVAASRWDEDGTVDDAARLASRVDVTQLHHEVAADGRRRHDKLGRDRPGEIEGRAIRIGRVGEDVVADVGQALVGLPKPAVHGLALERGDGVSRVVLPRRIDRDTIRSRGQPATFRAVQGATTIDEVQGHRRGIRWRPAR